MLLTNSFVYLPTEFFCPIPFTKPLSVTYIAVSVYGVFITIFATIYLRIYAYASQTTMITIQRRKTIDRQLIMFKRMVLPTFSLMFLGIVYLTLFFQAIANHYRTHFLTYRLSYLFIAIGMSFMHIITILQTPPIKSAILDLFYFLRGETRPLNTVSETLNSISQQQQRREDQMATIALLRDGFELIETSP
jgi:hypothetical protein